ncbi:tyrosine-type recombinase/integrase [Geomobilimonas luticola]|uniref:Site-specific integrase n=1 Tax=Geomobilimonas luticola TaxID=1114878 RepID=A0ABS5S856_9BACT|nr:site-specific integrase [Geomobilimonas luticola]MBT0651549.1 site-specific integrase [Geomobilimonas luticola]
MRTFRTNAFEQNPKYKMDRVPIFMTDDYEVIDEPTGWVLALIRRRFTTMRHGKTSPETIKTYSWILERFLRWLDVAKDVSGKTIGAKNWRLVDEDIMYEYANYLVQPPNNKNRLKQRTLKYYIYCLQDFYDWARKQGYEHYWDFDVKSVTFKLPNVGMWGTSVKRDKIAMNIGPEAMTAIENKRDAVVTREQLTEAIPLLGDFVYVIIAVIIASTGLRPKDLLQLPYRGKIDEPNRGLHPYETKGAVIPPTINYEFESKGKVRSIRFPGSLWELICCCWMPERIRRARLFYKKHGKNPSNQYLFLSQKGYIVTYDMIQSHFSKVGKCEHYSGHRFTARMLRHHFATYFIYDRLQKSGMLGNNAYQPHIDEELRQMMGHADVGTTYKFYVDLIQVLDFEGSVIKVLDEYFDTTSRLVGELVPNMQSSATLT